MRVSPDEARRVAALARLELADGEAEALARDLSSILDHVDALDDVDGDPGIGAGSAGADDLPGGDPLARPPSSFAPDFVDGFFTVPRLASHGGS